MKGVLAFACGLVIAAAATAQAATADVPVNKIDENGVGAPVGALHLSDTGQGLRVEPDLSGLPPGPHGFHVHANGDCGPGEQNGKKVAGLAAAGHFDPAKTGKHLGPEKDGHLGDMPVLTVDGDGKAKAAVTAPHLKLADVQGHAIIIHGGGDNYADEPAPLGGAGPRIACGLVK